MQPCIGAHEAVGSVHAMNPSLEALASMLHATYAGTVVRAGYGETVLFYNPELRVNTLHQVWFRGSRMGT